jgi:hypothetical protein
MNTLNVIKITLAFAVIDFVLGVAGDSKVLLLFAIINALTAAGFVMVQANKQ